MSRFMLSASLLLGAFMGLGTAGEVANQGHAFHVNAAAETNYNVGDLVWVNYAGKWHAGTVLKYDFRSQSYQVYTPDFGTFYFRAEDLRLR